MPPAVVLKLTGSTSKIVYKDLPADDPKRRKPDIINGSRRKRIARGSGTTVSQVNKLLKQYRDMRRMMRQINSAGGLEQFGKNVLGG